MNQMRVTILLMTGAFLILGGCDRSGNEVSFAAEVLPILERNCLECHKAEAGQAGYEASGLAVTTYEELMQGTRYGPVVLPGDSLSSALSMLIEGRADPSITMPHGDRPPLSQVQVDTIKTWIDQGAKNN